MANKSGLRAGTITTISNHASPHQPAVAAFRGVLFQAHTDTHEDKDKGRGLYCFGMGADNDPFKWVNYNVPGGWKTSASPSLAAFTDRLYMAWKGVGGNNEISYSRMLVKTDWEKVKKELEEHGEEWEGKSDEWKEKKWEEKKKEWKKLKDGWGPQRKVERSDVRTGMAPAIVNYPASAKEQKLFLFFVNEADSNKAGNIGWTQLISEGEKKDNWAMPFYAPAEI